MSYIYLLCHLELESTVNSYKAQMDEISHRYEITRIALKNMQDERNSAVNSAAAAFATQRHLQEENERLQEELDSLRAEKLQFEERLTFEREAWKAKEQIFRKRVDKAREAEGIAREAINGLQKKLEQPDKRTGTKPEQENEVAEMLKSGLQGLKPEVISTSAAASLLSKAASRRRFLASTLATHSAPATISISAPIQKNSVANTTGKSSTKQTTPKASGERSTKNCSSPEDANETAYTVDGNYIRRIADEVEEERRRRKEAEKRAAAASAEMERIREIVATKTASFRSKTGTTGNTKRQSGNAVSEFENNITVNVQNFPSRPLSAPPTSIICTTETTNGAQKASAIANIVPKAKKRRIKKVVYYEEGDTTEIVSIPAKGRTITTEQQRPKHPVAIPTVDSSSAKTISPPDVDATFYTAKKNSSSNSRRQTSNPDYDYDQQEANHQATLPPPPMIPNHIKSVIDPDAEHDPLTCTVCLRRESQSSQEDSKKATHAHVMDFTTAKQHSSMGYEELSSLRPSQPPQKQLNKVVRGLQDEFIHLKMYIPRSSKHLIS